MGLNDQFSGVTYCVVRH